MIHHPLCMVLWSGEADHCECPEANGCRACPDTCRECTWEQETCECYTHAEDIDLSHTPDTRQAGPHPAGLR